jgi:cytochrome P450
MEVATQLAGPAVNLSEASAFVDGPPYELFARMRAETPVHWTPPSENEGGFWSLTLYEDIVPVNKGWEDFSSARRGSFMTEGGIVPKEMASLVFNMMDPPEHDRHRGILQKVFTARAIAERAADVRATINGLIDQVIEHGECDLVKDLAVDLPLTVTANMLGAPLEDREQLFAWTNKFADTTLGPEEKLQAMAELGGGYLPELIAQRRKHPEDDLLSRLLVAELDGERLTDIEVIAHFTQLMLGGNETTRNAFAGGIWALIEHPAEMEKLRADPALMPNAVEEILRWHTPIMHQARTATHDLEIRGVPIAENDKVIMWYSSANRDPAQNQDPDRFDVSRERPKHLSFGAGRHFCLGNQLARLELQIGLQETLRRLQDLELAGPVERKPNNSFHWMVSLPVRFAPGKVEGGTL